MVFSDGLMPAAVQDVAVGSAPAFSDESAHRLESPVSGQATGRIEPDGASTEYGGVRVVYGWVHLPYILYL
jgi:hypothetical protein